MVGEMKGCEELVAREMGAEVDEGYVREEIRELLAKALRHRHDFRGLEATHDKVFWELIEAKAFFVNHFPDQFLIELTNRFEMVLEKGHRAVYRTVLYALNAPELLQIERKGKSWNAVSPYGKFRVFKKPSGRRALEIKLRIKVAEFQCPNIPQLPPELLASAQEGWVLGDASYYKKFRAVRMTTSQVIQALIFSIFWPGKTVKVYLRSAVIHEKWVSFLWEVTVKDVEAPPTWSLSKEEKQSLIITAIEQVNKNMVIDSCTALKLYMLYICDGKYPGVYSSKRILEFSVGRELYWLNAESSRALARHLLERVPRLVALMSILKKGRFLAGLAHGALRKARILRAHTHGEGYLVVSESLVLKLKISGSRYPVLEGWLRNVKEEEEKIVLEAARLHGIELKKKVRKGENGKVYHDYKAGMKSLQKFADDHPWAYDTYIDFVEKKLESTPPEHPSRPGLQRLLERLKRARERALKKHAGGENN